jgi:hypothetical protein
LVQSVRTEPLNQVCPHVIGRLDVVKRVAAKLNLGFKVVAATWNREEQEESGGNRRAADAEEKEDKDKADDDLGGKDLLRVVDMQTDSRWGGTAVEFCLPIA